MILVDADACPVIRLIEQIAEKYSVPCILFCDTNHVLSSDYSEVKVIGAGMDAVDFALVGACSRGDIVVSQDYGVAAMVLGKVLTVSIKMDESIQMKILTGSDGEAYG